MNEKNKTYSLIEKKEKNIQKRDFNGLYRSNSLLHYKDNTNYNYNHRIRLNPSGEYNTHDIRYHIPESHIKSYLRKTNHLTKSKSLNSFESAEIESKIALNIRKQKYQNLLENDNHINSLCYNKNKEIKEEIDKKKLKLKLELTRIINDTLLFSKKNNPVKSMLPENINEIVEKAKKQTQDLSLSLNISNLSKISSIRGELKKPKKSEFLTLIGVDVENMTLNHVNINIDKAWKFIQRISEGKDVEKILRYKVVNAIMSMTEKKASEKARNIYEKLEIYKTYMNKKKEEERKKRLKEEEQKYNELLKTNPKELIRQKMMKSLSQPKYFTKIENIKKKEEKKKKNKNKNLKRAESANNVFTKGHKKVTRLNSYKDVNKIIKFIDNSKKDSQSKLCKEHFINIQRTKEADNNIKELLKKNEIIFKN